MADKCSVLDCDRAARWRVSLRIWPKGVDRGGIEPAVLRMPLSLCGPCSSQRTAKDFISDEGWARIEEQFRIAGRLRPDRDSVELQLERIRY